MKFDSTMSRGGVVVGDGSVLGGDVDRVADVPAQSRDVPNPGEAALVPRRGALTFRGIVGHRPSRCARRLPRGERPHPSKLSVA